MDVESSDSEAVENSHDEDQEIDSEEDGENSVENDEAAAGPSGLDADEKQAKKKKRGIIYISSIPKYMNVTILREMLSQYAKIGRIFLQPGKLSGEFKALLKANKQHRLMLKFEICPHFLLFSIGEEQNRKKKKKRLARHFTEGWVEFESKRAAKRVAQLLNNAPIATRKSSKFYDILWVMKYLPRFKWVHLSERLTYEKAVHRQKLQTEISQARKEAAFFQENLDKSERFKKQQKKEKKANSFVEADA